jgi:hypothetical protein
MPLGLPPLMGAFVLMFDLRIYGKFLLLFLAENPPLKKTNQTFRFRAELSSLCKINQ